MALDVGKARIGVALSDSDAMLASPGGTITTESRQRGPDGEDIAAIVDLVAEHDVVEIIVGLPQALSGQLSPSAKFAREIAFRIDRALGGEVPIRFTDERFTTVTAQAKLHQAGRDMRASKSVIDQAAAIEILQNWLDQRRQQVT